MAMSLESNFIYFCKKIFNMRKFIAIAALGILTACGGGGGDNTAVEEKPKDGPLAQSKNSSDFNSKFTNFLNSYYHLKDAFVLSNADLANTSASLLVTTADSLNLKEVKADTSILEMAKGYLQTVSSEAKALAQEKDIEAKRKSFQMISDAMYDLVRTIRFDKDVVYHQFCPMAFNDAGAYWISATADIKNPYFGKKMLTCGEVKDSIDFRGK
jgi:uncharacterized protein YdbL (DUF1318 family)